MFFHKLFHVYYQSSSDGGTGDNSEDNQEDKSQDNQGEPETIEKWLSTQPKEIQDKVKPLFEAHVEKLSNTVKATRQERDAFQKQLNDTIKKAENGKVDKAELDKLSTQVTEANRKSDFYEQALQYECRNPKVAYALAVADDLFTRSGAPDWKAIQTEAPELFGKVSNAPRKPTSGSGTGNEPPPAKSMNDFIRKAAGVVPTE